MPVKEADPQAQSLDEAFAEAMGAPATPKEPGAPPAVDRDAPHGRDEDGKPLAPYGYTKEGAVRRGPQGRKAKPEDRPRVSPSGALPDDKGGKAAELAQPGQYSEALSDTADSIWFGMSALAKVGPGLPLIGKLVGKVLPEEKLSAQAAVWFATKDRAVAAVSLAAEHNASAARFARKLEGGDVTWMLTCISLVSPILALSGMVWAKDADAQLKAAGQPTLAELAERNEKAMEEAIALMTAQAEAHANQELAEQNGQPQ